MKVLLKDYIAKHHSVGRTANGSLKAFADAYGLKPQRVRRWVMKDLQSTIDTKTGVITSGRGSLLLIIGIPTGHKL